MAKHSAPQRLLRFSLRGGLATIWVGVVLIVTQDLQVFPAASISLLQHPGNAPAAPAGIEQWFIPTGDGEQIEVWCLPPPPPLTIRAPLLIVHGNGERLRDGLGRQRAFARAGFLTCAFDFRGFGHSSGWPTEEGIYRDTEAAWQHMLAIWGSAPAEAIVLGVSLGTGAAAWLAEQYGIQRLVLLSPYTSIPDVVRDRPVLKHLAPFLWSEFPTIQVIRRLNDGCAVIAHGRRDTIIGFEHATRLLSAAPAGLQVIPLFDDEADHNDLLGRVFSRLLTAIEACSIPRDTPERGH